MPSVQLREDDVLLHLDAIVTRLRTKHRGFSASREGVLREIVWDFLEHPEREIAVFGTRGSGAPSRAGKVRQSG